MPPVANDDFFNFFQTSFVNQHAADGRLSRDLRSRRPEPDDVAGFGHDDPILHDRRFLDQSGMPVKLSICSVNRNEIAWLHKRDHKLQFLLTGMPTHVDRRLAAIRIVDFRMTAIKVVDHAADRSFVSRNLPRRQNNRVASIDFQILVIVQRQSR